MSFPSFHNNLHLFQADENGEFEYFYGDQCQCSNMTCARYNGEICGGPERGQCDCGSCVCEKGWTGIACGKECQKSTDQCYDPNDPTEVFIVCSFLYHL